MDLIMGYRPASLKRALLIYLHLLQLPMETYAVADDVLVSDDHNALYVISDMCCIKILARCFT